jgi:anthranilate synthase component 1
MKYKLKTTYKKLLADTITPVSIYLKLRDKFPNSLLLESSDYHNRDNSFSYICCKPIATFKIENGTVIEQFPDGEQQHFKIDSDHSGLNLLNNFVNSFIVDSLDFKFISNGLFGYIAYDAVQYFEDIKLKSARSDIKTIPDLYYSVFRYVIAIDHFKNELYIFEHNCDSIPGDGISIETIESLIHNRNFACYKFHIVGKESSNLTDMEFMEIVTKGKQHCKRGDVIQIVLSREFKQVFQGDEFNVYRTLRAINPSPYLFFFDYGNFRIFGSSPEAHLTICNNVAGIHPIAGTYRRTGNEAKDRLLAEQLKADPKENAEHIMLVDLARNDLSRHTDNVQVETFSEIQYYSHVIHMVSKVTGKVTEPGKINHILADTFPAGTVSGAPKHMAMQLIDKYEKNSRGFYGGAIGFLGFNGHINHAIIIRSFLSKNNNLIYQAGSGIIAKSKEENELQEVNNKIAALRMAIKNAETI